MIRCFNAPYEGNAPFLFFSYCHEDASLAYPMIERLILEGYRVWFDNGVHPGDEWPDVVAEHLNRSSAFVAAISRASSASHNCRNEMSFAVSCNKPMLSVILESFEMPLGMKLQLGTSLYLHYHEYDQDAAFYHKLMEAPCLNACKASDVSASQADLEAWQTRKAQYSQIVRNEPASADAAQWLDAGHQPENDEPDAPAFERNPAEEQSPQMEQPRPEIPGQAAADDDSIVPTEDLPTELVSPFGDMPDDDQTLLSAETELAPAFLIRCRTGERFSLRQFENRIGRSASRSDIVILGNPGISRCHAEISQYNGKFMIRDMGSSAGTLMSGTQIAEDTRADMKDFEVITLAKEDFLFFANRAAESVLGLGKLCLLQSVDSKEMKLLSDSQLLLDRKHRWRDGVLSDTHIRRENNTAIIRENESYFVADIASKHGTFLNGRRLNPGERAQLKNGDILSVVQTKFEFIELQIKEEAHED